MSNMYNPANMAQAIKTILDEKQISPRKFATDCGISVNTIYKLKQGSDIYCSNLFKIADALGVSADFLMGRTDFPTSLSDDVLTGFKENQELFAMFSQLSSEEKELLKAQIKGILISKNDTL